MKKSNLLSTSTIQHKEMEEEKKRSEYSSSPQIKAPTVE